jgi:hypothetical protein
MGDKEKKATRREAAGSAGALTPFGDMERFLEGMTPFGWMRRMRRDGRPGRTLSCRSRTECQGSM